MTIAINSIHQVPVESDVDSIPKSPLPFYVLSKEGIFVKKTNVLGTSLIKASEMPPSLGELGFKNGYFSWEAPVVPAEICAQIVSFFKRIWTKHRTEAEVLLTARYEMENNHPQLKEWRVFIPTQDVSGGGVHSVYEPTHIAKDHLIVGTMHSHCNFSPFHSGIDINDASGFDGVHFTIGFVDRDVPEVASMVTMSGVRVDFKPETLADFSNLGAATAPTWWDDYVTPLRNTNKAIGSGLFGKYGQQEQAGYNLPPRSVGESHWNKAWNTYKPETPRKVKTLKELDDDKKDILPDDTRSLVPYGGAAQGEFSTDRRTYTPKDWDELMDQAEAQYWEDNADALMRDTLFDKGLLTEDDIDDLSKAGNRWQTFLRTLMFAKLVGTKDVLALMGVEVKINYISPTPTKLSKKLKPIRIIERSKPTNGNSRKRIKIHR